MLPLSYLKRRHAGLWPLVALFAVPACTWVGVELPDEDSVSTSAGGTGGEDTRPSGGQGGGMSIVGVGGTTGDGDGDGDGMGGTDPVDPPGVCEPDSTMYELQLIDDFERDSNRPADDFILGAWGWAYDGAATYTPDFGFANLEEDASVLNVGNAENGSDEMFVYKVGASNSWQPRAQLRITEAGKPPLDASSFDGVFICARGWRLDDTGEPTQQDARMLISFTGPFDGCASGLCATEQKDVSGEWQLFRLPFVGFEYGGVVETGAEPEVEITQQIITSELSHIQLAGDVSHAYEFHFDNLYFYKEK